MAIASPQRAGRSLLATAWPRPRPTVATLWQAGPGLAAFRVRTEESRGSVFGTAFALGSSAALLRSQRRRSSSAVECGGGDSERIVCKGDPIVVHYEGKLEDGTVFDTSEGGPALNFTVGKGEVVEGFDEAVRGMKVGELKTVTIPPDKAYGQRDDNMVITVPEKQVPAGMTEGMQVEFGSGGQKFPARVVKINEDGSAVIDANRPLAGKTLTFRLELVGFRELLAPAEADAGLELATFAAGCFWGVELGFQRVPGVVSTCVGYSQGAVERPSYGEICQGTTGHTEAVRVVYDPSVVTFDKLLETFWERVGKNATTINRAGNDTGTQYRSGIYFHNREQEAAARASVQELQEQLGKPVVAEVEAAAPFWVAEEYHQQYLSKGGRNNNPQSAEKGCTEVIRCYG